RTIPDKPRSRLQKYRLTPPGENALKKRKGGGES
ncbi:MAG: Fic family protein, partial [Rhodospirillales bacterium]